MAKSFPIFGELIKSDAINPDELIDLFLNGTADGICIVNMENCFIRVNEMYTKIFGYTEEELTGRKFNEMNKSALVEEVFKAVKQGEFFHDLVTHCYHKDGSRLDIAVSFSPLRNTAGEIIAIIGTYRDITKHLNIERDLKRTRELYRLITDNTTDMIKLYSKDKEVIYASPSHKKGVGIGPEELIGQDVYSIIMPEDREPFDQVYEALINTGEPQLFQAKMRTSDNGFIDVETTISPVYNEKGEFESFVTVGRDISDRIKNDDALRNLDRLSIIGQLAAGVAHEIRNPLTSLKGFSKLLKSTRDIQKQEDYLSIIMNELDRIDMIVNEFMSLAKPQAIQFERESLHDILESTVNILHPQALLHNVEIINCFKTDDIHLLGSRHQLKQVFVNFLKNAIESMPHGGQVHIHVEKMADNRVLICFTDEGIGIDNQLMGYLGTPFYTTKDKGIGLGLTVSNKIIQEHNGTMKIESELGNGTTITVELVYV
ncbi:PAS domain-containing sensor histidine kinase [Neobacillus cucumis]|uniref:histidine kinase n=1 Tax=Neobacillus cucumis TaxID=1740721 RepID=A0A2N5HJD5_9BACI|nr:PAS domain S-box protein [Neobacillus cucumis]PLS05614.1 PAS domain-containing sensor histidine kinase [Neobacillus cucumis]